MNFFQKISELPSLFLPLSSEKVSLHGIIAQKINFQFSPSVYLTKIQNTFFSTLSQTEQLLEEAINNLTFSLSTQSLITFNHFLSLIQAQHNFLVNDLSVQIFDLKTRALELSNIFLSQPFSLLVYQPVLSSWTIIKPPDLSSFQNTPLSSTKSVALGWNSHTQQFIWFPLTSTSI